VEETPAPQPPRLRRDLLHAGLFAPGRVLPAATLLLVVYLGNRILGLDELGRLSLYTTTIYFGSLVVGGWLNEATLRFLPAYVGSGRLEAYLHGNGAAMRRVTVLCAAGLVPALVLLRLLWGPPWLELLAFGVLLLLATWSNNSQNLLIGRADPWGYSGAELVRAVLSVGLCTLLPPGATVTWFLAALALANVAALAVSWWRSGGWHLLVPRAVDRAHLDEARAYGLPLVGWLIGVQMLAVSDRYLVGFFLGTGAVGVYHANYQFLPAAALVVAMPIIYAGLPHIMRQGPDGGETVARLTLRYSRIYVAATVPLCVLFSYLAHDAALLLFGPAIAAGAGIVPWVIAGNFYWSLAMYGQKRIEFQKRTRALLAMVAISVALKVVLGVLLIPRFGLLGAAWATALSYAVYPVMVYLHPSSIPWRVPVGLTAACLAASVAALLLAQLLVGRPAASSWGHLALLGLAFGALYAAFLGAGGLGVARLRRAA
jgi:O-antigen/teichoic acid export membrane protein